MDSGAASIDSPRPARSAVRLADRFAGGRPATRLPAAALCLLVALLDAGLLLAVRIAAPGGTAADAAPLSLGLAIAAIWWGGGYAHGGLFRVRSQAGAVLLGSAVAVASAAGLAALSACPDRWALAGAASFWPAIAATLMLGRAAVAAGLAADPRQRFALRTVLVGDDDSGRVAEQLRRQAGGAVALVATFLDAAARPAIEPLAALIRRGAVDQVVIVLPGDAALAHRELLAALAHHPVRVLIAVDPGLASAVSPSGASPVRLLPVLDRPISGAASLVKRVEDVVLALLGLALFAGPMLMLALAVRLDSPGPALFRQRRTGFNNRDFEMLKFRTMRVAEEQGGVSQATRDDRRVTRVGALLRRTSLDELPQLINVLRGEMSIVGPRPHAPGTRAGGLLFEHAVARYAARHRVKPGLTGLAQVRGLRGETQTTEKLARRLASDLEYIERWSPWLDLGIILRTAVTVLRMKNAY